jgi:hypothetical protein
VARQRLSQPAAGEAACLFSVDLQTSPHLEAFYRGLGAQPIRNKLSNSSAHAGGALGPFHGDNTIFLWGAAAEEEGTEWDHTAAIDLNGRGW